MGAQEPLRSEYLGSALGLGLLGNMLGPPLVGVIFDFAKSRGVAMPYFWALVHPIFLLALILLLLRSVPCQERRPLIDKGPVVQRAFAVYRSKAAVVLALELVCTFGCANSFLTAAATEMHRSGFKSSQIGLAAVPAAISQSVAAQWAGRYAGAAAQRQQVLVGTPFGLSLMLLSLALLSSWLPTAPMAVLTLLVTSMCNGMVDAPSMSLMADLANAQGLGYGQAVTASEMAVSLGLALGPGYATLLLHHGGYGLLCLTCTCLALLVGLAARLRLRDAG